MARKEVKATEHDDGSMRAREPDVGLVGAEDGGRSIGGENDDGTDDGAGAEGNLGTASVFIVVDMVTEADKGRTEDRMVGEAEDCGIEVTFGEDEVLIEVAMLEVADFSVESLTPKPILC